MLHGIWKYAMAVLLIESWPMSLLFIVIKALSSAFGGSWGEGCIPLIWSFFSQSYSLFDIL